MGRTCYERDEEECDDPECREACKLLRIEPPTPLQRAMDKFDDQNNVEPPRRIAERIALRYGAGPTHSLVDDIHHAIEDAYNLGVRRGVFHSLWQLYEEVAAGVRDPVDPAVGTAKSVTTTWPGTIQKYRQVNASGRGV